MAVEHQGVDDAEADIDDAAADALEELVEGSPTDVRGRLGLGRGVNEVEETLDVRRGGDTAGAGGIARRAQDPIGARGIETIDVIEIEDDPLRAFQDFRQPLVGRSHVDRGPVAGEHRRAAAIGILELKVGRLGHAGFQA